MQPNISYTAQQPAAIIASMPAIAARAAVVIDRFPRHHQPAQAIKHVRLYTSGRVS